MIPLPEHHELISFFETEPIIAFPEETWEYNHLTFVVNNGDQRLICEMEPAELILTLKLYEADVESLHLNLRSADNLKITQSDGREVMRVTFSDGIGVAIIQLKPRLHVFIETQMI